MLWAIIGILVLFWLIGFIAHIGGMFIHALLVIAAIVLIFKFVNGQRTKS